MDSLLNEKNDVYQDRFRCTFEGCKISFNRLWKLERHICTHTNERPFKCTHEACTKNYRCNSHLQRHISTAHGEKSSPMYIPCAYYGCSKMFANKYSLKKHCKSHMEMAYVCPKCHQGFRKRNQYNTHIMAHTGVLPFICGTCSVEFPSKRLLQRHERGCKTFACQTDNCDLIFGSFNSYRQHLKADHPTSFICAFCEKEFSNKAILREHVLSHLNPHERDVFICPYSSCPRYYYHKRNLIKHIDLFHLQTPLPKQNSEPKKRRERVEGPRKPRKPRKDKGMPQTSTAVRLAGLSLPRSVERKVATNTTTDVTDNVIHGIVQKVNEEEENEGQEEGQEEPLGFSPHNPQERSTIPKNIIFFVET